MKSNWIKYIFIIFIIIIVIFAIIVGLMIFIPRIMELLQK